MPGRVICSNHIVPCNIHVPGIPVEVTLIMMAVEMTAEMKEDSIALISSVHLGTDRIERSRDNVLD